MSMEKTYNCKRCNYASHLKTDLQRHLRRKNVCVPIDSEHDISTDDLLSELETAKYNAMTYDCTYCSKKFNSSPNMYRHRKSCKKRPTNLEAKVNDMEKEIQYLKEQLGQRNNVETSNMLALKRENQRLRNELIRYQTKRAEDFYQVIVENWLGGTYCTNAIGITDVTNDTIHAEVKGWKEWKYAMGQLMAYQTEDPKEHLYACMFGNYDNECKKKAIKVLNERGISCYEFAERDGIVFVVSIADGNPVFEYSLIDKT